ncbi:hypothetical protein ASG43_08855 [Aureimonas sp. Leaf454]|uniref:hypothetical protein n=1 Tax=Aureimonas sp. Leaf454 TaxID=1736381 RepID=UPI000701118D|nr:hypothetical protein [Aureimonas sp. Leaf454]KQT48932.1 hypothetical protein ASG43_08855 [Aureimonas sp. Leaf454]
MVKTSCTTHVATNLAMKAGRILAAHTFADEAGDRERRDTLRCRVRAMESEATWHRAGSPEAAFLQIGVARGIVDRMPDVEEREALNRVLASVAGLLEASTGVTRESAGLAFYGTAETDAELWV